MYVMVVEMATRLTKEANMDERQVGPFNRGDRIELVSMTHDPDPIQPGSQGTVRGCSFHNIAGYKFWQVDVAWDDGRQLMLSMPPDQAVKV